MSVFQKLKGSFQNAQQDIVDGFRALATLESQPRLHQLQQLRGLKARDINLDAGADLLFSYQKTWQTIQNDTKESAAKAGEASKLLTPMFSSWDTQAHLVQQLQEEVKTVPALMNTLVQLQQLIDKLRQDFQAAEKGLDMLQNLCEEQEHKKSIAEEEKKISVYAMQRENEYQKLKVDLAQRHARKMAQVESSKRAHLQERAEAFTSAFQEDVEYYRTHGRPDKLPTEFPKVTSLSEIEIEDDKQALDSFLGPMVDVSQAQEAVHDDDYIEDDYTTDFSVKEDIEDLVPDVNYLAVPAKINALSVESLDDDSEDDNQNSLATSSTNESVAQNSSETKEAVSNSEDSEAKEEIKDCEDGNS